MEKAVTICAVIAIAVFGIIALDRMVQGRNIVNGASVPALVHK